MGAEQLDVKRSLMRKVAQLTKVVVHLNARNDEAELRYERLRSSFEDEIRTITQDAILKVTAERGNLTSLADTEGLQAEAALLTRKWLPKRDDVREQLDMLVQETIAQQSELIAHGKSRLISAT